MSSLRFLLLQGAVGAGPALLLLSAMLGLFVSPFVLMYFLRSATPTWGGRTRAVAKAVAALVAGIAALYVVLFYAV